MIQTDELIEIGVVRKTHGTRGEVAVSLSRDLPEDTDLECVMLLIDSIPVPFFVADWRYKSDDTMLLTFDDIDSEAAAKRLTGCKVYVEKQVFGENNADSLTWAQLVGYTVKTDDGKTLGKIVDVDESTINTLFELDGGIVLPAHEDFIIALDTDNRELLLSLPEGLV